MNKVVVIGGGAAGMMAAASAAKNGAKVVLLERNEKLGKKIYITGKGRCNVTNNVPVEEFLKEIPKNPKFLYSAMNHFSPEDTIRFFEDEGCHLKTERGNRVFPISEKASDVTKTLKKQLEKYDVQVLLDKRVNRLTIKNGQIQGVELFSGEKLDCDALIIATGGKSYPVTGSTGDGYGFAQEAGHSVSPPLAALVPLTSKEDWPMSLQGLALKNVMIIGEKKNKKVFSELGEMLFTHFGFSGPLILELSSHIQGEDLNQWKIYLDLKPGLNREQLETRVLRDFSQQPNKQILSILQGLLPARLAEVFAEKLDISFEKPVNQITKVQREAIINSLKTFMLPVSGFRPIDEAIITRGGVNVKEIYPGTMESKKCKGLYFAGEVLDVDGHTGGYNLQIAFSTGSLAGESAAQSISF